MSIISYCFMQLDNRVRALFVLQAMAQCEETAQGKRQSYLRALGEACPSSRDAPSILNIFLEPRRSVWRKAACCTRLSVDP